MSRQKFSLFRTFSPLLVLIMCLGWLNLAWNFAPDQPWQSEPSATPTASLTATLTPTSTPILTHTLTITRTRTLIPKEYLETEFQTSGLMIGGVVLLVIIVGGTLIGLRRR